MSEVSKESCSKTFAKETQFHEVIEWVSKQIETVDWQPDGTNWIDGGPAPIDPRCDLSHKYTITIKKHGTN